MQEQHCQIIAALFDKYYQGDPSVIMGPILRGMYQCHCWASIFWYGPDRENERERIGAKIKSLRMECRMDARDVAQLADIVSRKESIPLVSTFSVVSLLQWTAISTLSPIATA